MSGSWLKLNKQITNLIFLLNHLVMQGYFKPLVDGTDVDFRAGRVETVL